MLSATDGTHGPSQVTHVAQADKVTHPENTWARRGSFLGYESVKSSEQALQDLCSVTVTVFSMLLNLLPEQRSPNLPKIARLATGCRCEVDDFISQAHLCRINDPGLAGQAIHEQLALRGLPAAHSRVPPNSGPYCTGGVYTNGILSLSVTLVKGFCASYAACDVMLRMDITKQGFES
ncbi:uncharacterized protein LOC142772354 [Rhipicephalus microplus]|uniref:uncharacterized protein LOC142772354 n=1 Tax=Rhipicephalus microplus TaxID=6941 RepID=UPI003F6BA3AB